jgi:probable F420-dependent oxidoreductase
VKFGIHIKQAGPGSSAEGIFTLASAVEELGYDSIWLFDHLIGPTDVQTPYPGAADGVYDFAPEFNFFETVTVLAALAARTSRVRLGTRVLVSILRPPVLLAKELATIDSIAGGRVVLGVGTGWMREEFDAVGVPMEERLARLDEHVAVLQGAWRGISSWEGRFYRHVEAGFYPQPPQPRGIPILLGGFRDAVLRRVAAYADGWAVFSPPTVPGSKAHDLLDAGILKERLDTLRRFCDEANRDFDQLEIVEGATFGTPVADLEAHAALGVTTCDILSFAPPDTVAERAASFAAAVGTELSSS